ncbi:MAG: DUF4276 family protein [Tannerellaceae bacterium]|jgi:hypothetical protein|nr:DUF4276 family protein [Tannerellaceae bacterium]
MKKVAIFVEGQTEQIFVKKIIERILSPGTVTVTTCQLRGGAKYPRMLILLEAQFATPQSHYYFEIYDCGNDSKVKDDIIEHLPFMKRNGFSMVIGIRDVYPNNAKIAQLRKYLTFGIPAGIPAHIVLAVNEVEAWFMAEEKHYEKINPKLTIAQVNAIAGIDVSTDSTEMIAHPAEKLQHIYNYTKRKHKVTQIVNALDYDNLYMNVRPRNESLNELLTHLDSIRE